VCQVRHDEVVIGLHAEIGGVNTVRTTGIYCRSGCSARPHPANTGWMQSAVAAEVAGYRPCLRCRPDHLSVVPIDEGNDPFITAALDLINEGFLDDHGEVDLAMSLGLSSRHLLRLFRQSVGATPTQVGISRRAHFARLLLDDTDLSVTEIAFAAGFGSLRRMNEVTSSTFGFAPTELRLKRAAGQQCSVDGGIRLILNVHKPYRFEEYLRVLRDRVIPGVESIDGETFRRATNVCGFAGVVEVRSPRSGTIEVVAHLPALSGLVDVVARYRRVFRLDHLSDGPPGHWSHFEAAVLEILRMRCRDSQAMTRELVVALGAPVPGAGSWRITHQFPDPLSLLQLEGTDFEKLDLVAKHEVIELARNAVQAVTNPGPPLPT
jgi:AraC family transcriptional regulator of adaptative response / DNA-3-methyladenine glycosylase II